MRTDNKFKWFCKTNNNLATIIITKKETMFPHKICRKIKAPLDNTTKLGFLFV
jgi:hypothetical protein